MIAETISTASKMSTSKRVRGDAFEGDVELDSLVEFDEFEDSDEGDCEPNKEKFENSDNLPLPED